MVTRQEKDANARFAQRNGYHVTTTIDGVPEINATGDAFTHVVLQLECKKIGCPTTRARSEDIQIDWLRGENPA